MGRRKIKIQPIQDERSKQITFLKRKHGLMKKAYELSVLCNCEIALLIFNTSGNLIEYSSSDIDQIMLKYTEYTDLHETKSNLDFINGEDGREEEGDETLEHEPEIHNESDQRAENKTTPPAPLLIPRAPVVMTQQEQSNQPAPESPPATLHPRLPGYPSYTYVPPPPPPPNHGYQLIHAMNPGVVPYSQILHQQRFGVVPAMPPQQTTPASAAPPPNPQPQPYTLGYPPTMNERMMASTPTTYPMPFYQHAQQGQMPAASRLPQDQPFQAANRKPSSLRVKIPQQDNQPGAQERPSEQQPYLYQPPSALFPPPSALPSQFAYNLPSPSTFYPDFYPQHNELTSPLYIIATPIAGTSFNWPSRNLSISGPLPSPGGGGGGVAGSGGGPDFRPSPLAKSSKTPITKRNHDTASSNNEYGGEGRDPKKSKWKE
ncbi:hypothetical protein MBANPS3_000388 [Mucor bainieri]